MTKSEPVTLPARSLASSTTRSATSSGRVNRPVTVSAAACLATSPASRPCALATLSATPPSPSHSWVDAGPGLTVLTRIPFGPTSLESALEKFSRAAALRHERQQWLGQVQVGDRDPGTQRDQGYNQRARVRFLGGTFRFLHLGGCWARHQNTTSYPG
jgi:hypothetical protein